MALAKLTIHWIPAFAGTTNEKEPRSGSLIVATGVNPWNMIHKTKIEPRSGSILESWILRSAQNDKYKNPFVPFKKGDNTRILSWRS